MLWAEKKKMGQKKEEEKMLWALVDLGNLTVAQISFQSFLAQVYCSVWVDLARFL